MLFFLDEELSRRSQINAPEFSDVTVDFQEVQAEAQEKAEENGATKYLPLLGETGDTNEPSESELIELMTYSNVEVKEIRLRDTGSRDADASEKNEVGR
jgi:hypothetical protein